MGIGWGVWCKFLFSGSLNINGFIWYSPCPCTHTRRHGVRNYVKLEEKSEDALKSPLFVSPSSLWWLFHPLVMATPGMRCDVHDYKCLIVVNRRGGLLGPIVYTTNTMLSRSSHILTESLVSQLYIDLTVSLKALSILNGGSQAAFLAQVRTKQQRPVEGQLPYAMCLGCFTSLCLRPVWNTWRFDLRGRWVDNIVNLICKIIVN